MPYYGSGKRSVKKNQNKKKTMAKSKKMRKSRAIVPSAVKSYVNKAIAVHAENKQCASVSLLNDNINNMFSVFGTVINCSSVWSLSQGTGQGNRIGNVILPKTWTIKGYVSVSNVAGSLTAPGVVKMYLIKYKNGFTGPTSVSSCTDFYQGGNSSVAPAGTYIDVLRTVNKDVYTVYTTRTFKVGPASVSGATTYTNNDFKATCPFKIDLKKYQSHKIKYADTTTTPTNSGLFLVFAFAPYDGSVSNGGTNSNLPLIHYDIDASFEDA